MDIKHIFSKFFLILISTLLQNSSCSAMQESIDDHAQETEFHERLIEAYPQYLEENVQAFYKRIEPLTSEQPERPDHWHMTSVTIGNEEISPDDQGVYRSGDINFRISLPDNIKASQILSLSIAQNEIYTDVQFNKVQEKKIAWIPTFESYNDLLKAIDNNMLFSTDQIIFKGLLRIPGQQVIIIDIEIENKKHN